jgi:hypothetical protein
MTRFIHDQFAKDYLEELLSSLGEVKSARVVRGEVQRNRCLVFTRVFDNNPRENCWDYWEKWRLIPFIRTLSQSCHRYRNSGLVC